MKEFAVVDADGEDARGLEHVPHHRKTRVHEAHPLGVLRRIVLVDELTEVGIVRVGVPLVVVAEVPRPYCTAGR